MEIGVIVWAGYYTIQSALGMNTEGCTGDASDGGHCDGEETGRMTVIGEGVHSSSLKE